MSQLHDKLGDEFHKFESLKKSSFALGSELWEENYMPLMELVKEYIVDVWEIRKARLYGNNPNANHTQSSSTSHDNTNPIGCVGKLRCQVGKTGTCTHSIVVCACDVCTCTGGGI